MRAAPLLRRTLRSYRPHLLPLEERLPLGDGVLGLLAGAALLPLHDAPPAVPQQQGWGAGLVGRIGNPSGHRDGLPIRSTAEAFASVSAEDTLAAPAWQPLPDLFAPAARRQRQPGMELQPLLALQAGEEQVTPPVPATAPAFVAAIPHSGCDLLTTLAALYQPAAPARAAGATPTQQAQVKENFGKLPLYFEENVGQTDAAVHFFTRGPGYGLYLTATEAVMVLSQPTPTATNDPASDRLDAGRAGLHTTGTSPVARQEEPPAVVRMQVVGANATPAVTGRDQQPGVVNYFLGNDPAKWHTNIHTFARVEYDEVYPGIDLVYYGTQQQLEYDFVVSPGADPNVIRLNVSGAERVELDAAGDLVVHVGEPGGVSPGRTLRQHKPFVYQTVDSVRQEVPSRFVLDGQQVRFTVGAYDASRPLVIDPVLSYSTYLGGSGEENEIGKAAIAVDPATGDALLTGGTSSTDFPTAKAFQPTRGGCYQTNCDAFIVRLRADGAALVYSTYLGGNSGDRGRGVALDPATGDVLLTGNTLSTNFPTVRPLQERLNGNNYDAFVTRLRGDGQALVYSTYLGGSNQDLGLALAMDHATGDVVLTGSTFSTNFPVANALQGVCRGSVDAFVARLRADGQALVYSTYFGGTGSESGTGLAVDPVTGDVLLSGNTDSTNFPTANPLQRTCGGCPASNDAFVTRLRADGRALIYSTYLGGSGSDTATGLAVDPATGDAVVTGYTLSTNFPTANPLQGTYAGSGDVFVTRLRPDGTALVYSTYLGGSGGDTGGGVAVDPVSGNILLTGGTGSPNFPTVNPLQGSLGGSTDAFVTRLRADGTALVYSTYLGGRGQENVLGEGAIAVDPTTGDALLTGYTLSPDFPTTPGAFDRTCGTDGNCNGQYRDAFVARIGTAPVTFYYVYPDSGTVQAGVPFDLSVYALDAAGNVLPDYIGEIAFFSTDKQATLPQPYTFQRQDQGLAYFSEGVTLLTPGMQELYVFDTATYKIFGYAVFEVSP